MILSNFIAGASQIQKAGSISRNVVETYTKFIKLVEKNIMKLLTNILKLVEGFVKSIGQESNCYSNIFIFIKFKF